MPLQAKISEAEAALLSTMRPVVAVVRRPVAMSYAVAVAAVVAAFLLRWALFGILDTRLPFAFFLPAAMVAAWYGGFGPGLLAAGAGLLLGDYFFLPPHNAWGPLSEADRTALTIYALTSTFAVMLFDNLHLRIRKLECELNRRESERSATH